MTWNVFIQENHDETSFQCARSRMRLGCHQYRFARAQRFGLCERMCACACSRPSPGWATSRTHGAPPRTGHSRTIGCLLPSIANPFVAQLLSEVERLAQAAGYSLLVGSSGNVTAMELVAFFENRRLEGIIALPAHGTTPSPPRPSPPRSCPRSSWTATWAGFRCRTIDHEPGMRQVMDYLLSLGHQRIALFAIGSQGAPGAEAAQLPRRWGGRPAVRRQAGVP